MADFEGKETLDQKLGDFKRIKEEMLLVDQQIKEVKDALTQRNEVVKMSGPLEEDKIWREVNETWAGVEPANIKIRMPDVGHLQKSMLNIRASLKEDERITNDLVEAVRDQDISRVMEIVEDRDLHGIDSRLLIEACQHPMLQLIKMIGPDDTYSDVEAMLPSALQNQLTIVRFLISQKIEITDQALITVVRNNNLPLFKLMIRLGKIDLNVSHLLDLAISLNHGLMIEYLLTLGVRSVAAIKVAIENDRMAWAEKLISLTL